MPNKSDIYPGLSKAENELMNKTYSLYLREMSRESGPQAYTMTKAEFIKDRLSKKLSRATSEGYASDINGNGFNSLPASPLMDKREISNNVLEDRRRSSEEFASFNNQLLNSNNMHGNSDRIGGTIANFYTSFFDRSVMQLIKNNSSLSSFGEIIKKAQYSKYFSNDPKRKDKMDRERSGSWTYLLLDNDVIFRTLWYLGKKLAGLTPEEAVIILDRCIIMANFKTEIEVINESMPNVQFKTHDNVVYASVSKIGNLRWKVFDVAFSNEFVTYFSEDSAVIVKDGALKLKDKIDLNVPELTALDFIKENAPKFYELISSLNLTAYYQQSQQKRTFVVLNNRAMESFYDEYKKELPLELPKMNERSKSLLISFIKEHIMDKAIPIFIMDPTKDKYTSLLNTEVSLKKGPKGYYLNSSFIEQTDIAVKNGIVQIATSVLDIAFNALVKDGMNRSETTEPSLISGKPKKETKEIRGNRKRSNGFITTVKSFNPFKENKQKDANDSDTTTTSIYNNFRTDKLAEDSIKIISKYFAYKIDCEDDKVFTSVIEEGDKIIEAISSFNTTESFRLAVRNFNLRIFSKALISSMNKKEQNKFTCAMHAIEIAYNVLHKRTENAVIIEGRLLSHLKLHSYSPDKWLWEIMTTMYDNSEIAMWRSNVFQTSRIAMMNAMNQNILKLGTKRNYLERGQLQFLYLALFENLLEKCVYPSKDGTLLSINGEDYSKFKERIYYELVSLKNMIKNPPCTANYETRRDQQSEYKAEGFVTLFQNVMKYKKKVNGDIYIDAIEEEKYVSSLFDKIWKRISLLDKKKTIAYLGLFLYFIVEGFESNYCYNTPEQQQIDSSNNVANTKHRSPAVQTFWNLNISLMQNLGYKTLKDSFSGKGTIEKDKSKNLGTLLSKSLNN